MLPIALAIQLAIGVAYFFAGGLGGGPEFTRVMQFWLAAFVAIIIACVLVGIRRLRPTFVWVGPIAVVCTLAAWPAFINTSLGGGGCSGDQRTMLNSIPAYGDASITMVGRGGVCSYSFETSDPPNEVLTYYRSQLEGAGWTITEVNQEPGVTEGAGTIAAGHLEAIREGAHFSVTYEMSNYSVSTS